MVARLDPKVSMFISREISRQREEGKPQAQSIAIAFSKATRKFGRNRIPSPPRSMKKLRMMS